MFSKLRKIKGLILLSIAVFILLALPLGSWANDGVDATNGNAISSQGVSTSPSTVSPISKEGAGCKILWDLSNGVYLSYQPSGNYSTLAADLTALGYSLTTCTTGILNANLSQYDILVICLGSAWNKAYTPTEVAAVKSFVAAGGGLLVMGDNTSCPNLNINPITVSLGTTCGVSEFSTGDEYISNFSAHPIFNGIRQFHYVAGGEINGVAPSVEQSFFDTTKATVNTVEFERGRAVIAGDINFADNLYIGTVNNQLLAENIFSWLCGAGGGACAIQPGDAKVWTGTTFTLPINVISAPNQVKAFRFTVKYDPAVLRYNSFTRGNLTTNFDFFDVNAGVAGTIVAGGIEAGADAIVLGASGSALNISFTAIGQLQPNQCTTVTVEALTDDIANWTPCAGNVCYSCPHDGDVNGDGRVTPGDALLAFQFSLGIIKLDDCQQAHADVNNDGRVTPADALCIFQKSLGLPSCLN